MNTQLTVNVQLRGRGKTLTVLCICSVTAIVSDLLGRTADASPPARNTTNYASAEHSHHPSGICSYVAGSKDEWRLICLRLGMAGAETLFSAALPSVVKAPVSFEDCVVTVNALGDLHVYDLTGRETLHWLVPSIQGAISQMMRFGYVGRRVLLVHNFFGPQSRVQKTELVVIEIANNARAVVRKRVILDWPSGVHYASMLSQFRAPEVLIVGEKETRRLSIEVEAPESQQTNAP